MKIKNIRRAKPISEFKAEENQLYFMIGNDRKQQTRRMIEELGIKETQTRTFIFNNQLQGVKNWSLIVFDGYDNNNLKNAVGYNPIDIYNALTSDDDNSTSEGNPTTPLEKAVLHLMNIGSTNRQELSFMAKQFITEKGACEKLGISYWIFAKEKIKDQVRALFFVGTTPILKINQEFFDKSEFSNLQLLSIFFSCEVVIDNSVEDYKLEAKENVSIQ